MEEAEHEYLKTVWKEVFDHPFAWPFRRSVEQAQPNIDYSDYCEIISEPMHLRLIQANLRRRTWYRSTDECIEDFKTIFTNSYAYYKLRGQNKGIFHRGKVLREFFLKRIDCMPKKQIALDSTMTDSKEICWTLKLEDVPSDELRMIFSFLRLKDLKNLKLASKKSLGRNGTSIPGLTPFIKGVSYESSIVKEAECI